MGVPNGGRCFRSKTLSNLASTTTVAIVLALFRIGKGKLGEHEYLNMISLFLWSAGGCRVGAVMGVSEDTGWHPNLKGKPPGFEPPLTLGDRANGVRDILGVELLSVILPFVTGAGR